METARCEIERLEMKSKHSGMLRHSFYCSGCFSDKMKSKHSGMLRTFTKVLDVNNLVMKSKHSGMLSSIMNLS